jgi:serine/threonine protein kinase
MIPGSADPKSSQAQPSWVVGPSIPAASRLGQVIEGEFLIKGVLGQGELGVTYEAENARLKRKFAVLMLKRELKPTHEMMLAVRNDLRRAQQLGTAGLMPVKMLADRDGIPGFATELLDGETLRARLNRGPLRAERALAIVVSVARTLEAAHKVGLVHGDLRPENIFLVRTTAKNASAGKVMVVEHGMHHLRRRAAGLDDRLPLYKHLYRPPEQVAGMIGATERGDVFVLGAILHECLTARPAFFAEEIEFILENLASPPPPLSPSPATGLSPELAAALTLLIRQACALQLEERVPSMNEFVEGIDQIVQGYHIKLPEPAVEAKDEVTLPAKAPTAESQSMSRLLQRMSGVFPQIALPPTGSPIGPPSEPPAAAAGDGGPAAVRISTEAAASIPRLEPLQQERVSRILKRLSGAFPSISATAPDQALLDSGAPSVAPPAGAGDGSGVSPAPVGPAAPQQSVSASSAATPIPGCVAPLESVAQTPAAPAPESAITDPRVALPVLPPLAAAPVQNAIAAAGPVAPLSVGQGTAGRPAPVSNDRPSPSPKVPASAAVLDPPPPAPTSPVPELAVAAAATGAGPTPGAAAPATDNVGPSPANSAGAPASTSQVGPTPGSLPLPPLTPPPAQVGSATLPQPGQDDARSASSTPAGAERRAESQTAAPGSPQADLAVPVTGPTPMPAPTAQASAAASRPVRTDSPAEQPITAPTLPPAPSVGGVRSAPEEVPATPALPPTLVGAMASLGTSPLAADLPPPPATLEIPTRPRLEVSTELAVPHFSPGNTPAPLLPAPMVLLPPQLAPSPLPPAPLGGLASPLSPFGSGAMPALPSNLPTAAGSLISSAPTAVQMPKPAGLQRETTLAGDDLAELLEPSQPAIPVPTSIPAAVPPATPAMPASLASNAAAGQHPQPASSSATKDSPKAADGDIGALRTVAQIEALPSPLSPVSPRASGTDDEAPRVESRPLAELATRPALAALAERLSPLPPRINELPTQPAVRRLPITELATQAKLTASADGIEALSPALLEDAPPSLPPTPASGMPVTAAPHAETLGPGAKVAAPLGAAVASAVAPTLQSPPPGQAPAALSANNSPSAVTAPERPASPRPPRVSQLIAALQNQQGPLKPPPEPEPAPAAAPIAAPPAPVGPKATGGQPRGLMAPSPEALAPLISGESPALASSAHPARISPAAVPAVAPPSSPVGRLLELALRHQELTAAGLGAVLVLLITLLYLVVVR